LRTPKRGSPNTGNESSFRIMRGYFVAALAVLLSSACARRLPPFEPVQVPEGRSVVYVYWPWVRGLGYFPPTCETFPLEERRDGLLSCTSQHTWNGAVSPERQEQFLELYRDRPTDTIVDARQFGFWQRPTMWDSISCGEGQSTWLRGGGYSSSHRATLSVAQTMMASTRWAFIWTRAKKPT